MTNWRPRFLVSTAVSGRANASVPPPAGNGTISMTGLLGHVCALTAPPPNAATAAAARSTTRRESRAFEVMRSPRSRCSAPSLSVRARLQQRRKRARMYHPAVHETIVASLDARQVVQVVDHQAGRLLERLGRRIGAGVEPLQARAVVEVEARHRVAAGSRRGE